MIDSPPVSPNDSSPSLPRFVASFIVLASLAVGCAAPSPGPVVLETSPEPTAARPSRDGVDETEGPRPDATTTTEPGPDSARSAPQTGGETADATTPAEGETADAATPAESAGEESAPETEASEEEEEDDGPIVLDTAYDDARVGEDQTSLIEAELGLVEDEALNRYVRRVALRLLRHATPRPFDWEFKIVDQHVPNAFALPGGKIYVSRGLLALATSEDELAAVLGHEITHATERHAAARIEYAKRLNPFTIGLLRLARIAAYGRHHERDADRGGQLLAAKAGYDPRGIATFLRKLDAAERYEIGWSRLPSFFATHPTSPERAAIASDRANALAWERGEGVAGESAEAYYAMIDGLVLGEDPAGGLFDEENRFVHPELRFSLRFPPGWETMNSQQAVRALSPRRDAQAELTVAGDASRPLDEVIDEFLESEFEGLRFRATERREIRVGELPAVRVEGRVGSPLGRIGASMTFVAYEGLVYRLTMLTLPGAADRYRGRTRAFSQSFRPLDEAGMHSLRVTRLRVARALENETLAELSERTRNELEVVFTGVLNGLYASTPLERRHPIKIGIAEPYLPKTRPDEPEAPSGAPEADGGAVAGGGQASAAR